jgi:hypothetical protein
LCSPKYKTTNWARTLNAWWKFFKIISFSCRRAPICCLSGRFHFADYVPFLPEMHRQLRPGYKNSAAGKPRCGRIVAFLMRMLVA